MSSMIEEQAVSWVKQDSHIDDRSVAKELLQHFENASQVGWIAEFVIAGAFDQLGQYANSNGVTAVAAPPPFRPGEHCPYRS